MKHQSKHTPGPWKANGRIIEKYDTGMGIGAFPIASVLRGYKQEENAALIAAAPELLEAAKWVLLEIANGHGAHGEPESALRAAVAKAEGASK